MMQMVLSIKANDKVDFRENPVTCYTCHRGQTKPVGLPPMPLARSGHEPGPSDAVSAVRPASPSVDQIFAKYVEAVGGSAATGAKTRVLKGKREASQNRNWPNEIKLAFQTGLLLRKITINQTVLVPFPEQIDFEDYRDVDGVKVPFTIRYSAIDTFDSWTRTFTEIKRNALVEDTLFAVPVASPK